MKFSLVRRQAAFTILVIVAYWPIASRYAMKLAEASTGLTIPALNQSLSKLPALTARAWVGAENGSPDGPSDTKAKYMSQIQAKQDPAILSPDNSRIVSFSTRRSAPSQVGSNR
jgi:hypothetical protein